MPISLVTSESLPSVWAKLRPQILRALDTGMGEHYTEEYYYQAVFSGKMTMWAFHEADIVAAGIISVNEHPKDKSIFIELLAGSRLDDWIGLVEPLLHEYAKQIGATTIEASCRPGLADKLKNWRPVAVLMRLENGRQQQT